MKTIRPLCTIALAALVSACSGSRSTGTTEPTNSSGSAINGPSDAEAPSSDASITSGSSHGNHAMITAVLAAAPRNAAAPTRAARILFGPIAVDNPSEPGRHAVAVVDNDGPTLVYTAVPFVAEQAATGSLTNIEATKVSGLAVRRINGDPQPDFVVFTSDETVVPEYVAIGVRALMFTLDTRQERTLAPLVRAQLELAGVTTEAELDAQLPTLGRFEAPTASTPPGRFLARLHYATAEQFVSVVAASGIRLCMDEPDRRGVRHKRCRSYARNRIAAEYTARYNIQRTLANFTEVESDDHDNLSTPSCRPEPQLLQCNANFGGPIGVDWQLVTENNVLRIAELSAWHESS